MKNKLILFVLSTVLLSSCVGEYSVMKRRYNKGFYVSTKHQKKNVQNQAVALKHPNLQQETVQNSYQPFAAVKPVALRAGTSAVKEGIITANTVKSENLKPNSNAVVTTSAAKALIKSAKAVKPLKQVSKAEIKTMAGEGSTNTVLLVILALFPILALIAVYLKDGGVTLNFWVTLLLHFVALYWLFALLVVLDVIDLG